MPNFFSAQDILSPNKASVTTDRNDMLNKIKESIINAINGM